jgi:glutamate racemase
VLGIYDSGIGGVAVLERLHTVSPNLNFIYLADQALFPIGQKSKSEVIQQLKKVFSFFISKKCQEVLLACNTVSAIYAVNHNEFAEYKDHLKIYTITGPTVSLLNENYSHLQKEKGIMIATTATIKSNYYQAKLPNFKKLKYTYLSNLAWAIEEQNYEEIRQSLLKNSHLDWNSLNYIILGCTHYTWIKPIFMFLNPSMQVIDPVSESTGFLAKNLSLQSSDKPVQKFYSTGSKLKVEDRNYRFKKVQI